MVFTAVVSGKATKKEDQAKELTPHGTTDQ